MVSDATSATTSATTSVSDPNLRGATNSDVDVSATSATEIEIKQESLVSLVALPSLTTQPHQPPLPTKQGEDEEVDQLADEYKETHALTANGHPAPSLVLDPAQSLKQELAAAAAAAAAALSITNLPSTDSEVHVDADGDITMKNESSVDVAALDTAMQVEPTISTAAELEAAAVVAAVVATTLPVVLPVPPTTTTTTTTTTTITTTTLPSATFVTVPLIPTVGVPNNVGEQDQLLSPSPSPQRPGSPSQLQQQQQQQERPSSHSPPSSSTSLKPTAGDTKPRSKSFDANAASAALATTTLATASSSTPSSSSSAAASGSTLPATTTGKAPRVRKGAPPTEKKPLKVYPPRKQRSRVNWDEAKVPPESPLSTLASAAVAVSTLSAATAITPASTMPITPTVSAAANGGAAGATTTASTAASAAAAAAAGGVGTGGAGVGNGSGSSGSSGAASSSAGGVGSSIGGSVPSVGASSGLATVGGAVPVTTHHAVPDDATLQALSKARAQLAAEGGGYRCELCPGERFGRVHDLKRHHISKHNEMTWPCDFCHRPFVRRDALLRHYTVKAARNDGVHPTQDEQDRLSEARARAKLLS
ncbi:hypothetical protein BGZ73_003319 [Actinomortierella ambigua]|nr:hypothetical protein BGZ73_003319 [Actinomortierella ambigua]